MKKTKANYRKRRDYDSESESSSESDSEEYGTADDEDDDSNESDDDASSDDESEGDDEKDFNIIFTTIANSLAGGNAEDEAAIRDDGDEECNSDDEKTFMKEAYIPIEMPKIEDDVSNTRSLVKSKKSSKKGRKSNSEKQKKDDNTDTDVDAEGMVETEYRDLIELKKQLTEKLVNKPKSKILIHAIEECNDSIKKLIKKTRMKNAKKYYKIINAGEELHTSEIEYFKKNMSHKEQIKAINEYKAINEHIIIKKPYRLALLESDIPAKYKATVMQKINMLRSMDPGDNEYYKLKTWVDAFMRIPFSVNKHLTVNISDGIEKCSDFMNNAKRTLDECVFGLNDAKMQIMQMVGQWIANPDALGTAIAIKGPMGTGKSSLAKDGISKILGREFTFIALGGTGDASFLEGHSYTYEGSMWGKIVQILIESKCMNPVIYFDELDKVSDTPRGEEIIGILTHLTDTTQNNQFHDKYFSEVDFDLSKCLFIFSYNDESKVNPILRDRMYRIQTKGYDTKEKLTIAKNFLLPKIREQVAFKEEEVIIPDETLEFIITTEGYSKKEEGVRNLKRCLEIIYTKLNLFRLMKPDQNLFKTDMELEVKFPFTVTKKAVEALIKNEETLNQSLLAMYV
jgi:ATP-dependent Lon protease